MLHACALRFVTIVFHEKFLDLNTLIMYCIVGCSRQLMSDQEGVEELLHMWILGLRF
jgi:hypothetical protein